MQNQVKGRGGLTVSIVSATVLFHTISYFIHCMKSYYVIAISFKLMKIATVENVRES